jgi:hypothetical protein
LLQLSAVKPWCSFCFQLEMKLSLSRQKRQQQTLSWRKSTAEADMTKVSSRSSNQRHHRANSSCRAGQDRSSAETNQFSTCVNHMSNALTNREAAQPHLLHRTSAVTSDVSGYALSPQQFRPSAPLAINTEHHARGNSAHDVALRCGSAHPCASAARSLLDRARGEALQQLL